MFRSRFHIIWLGFIALFVVGCTDKSGGRVEVAGTVKLGAQPLKDGTISFEPLEGQPTRATATITNGAYSIPKDKGLQPGKYLIRVSAGDGRTAVNPVSPDQPPGPVKGTNIVSKDLVPAAWNVDSKQECSVTKDSPNKFDFDIP